MENDKTEANNRFLKFQRHLNMIDRHRVLYVYTYYSSVMLFIGTLI